MLKSINDCETERFKYDLMFELGKITKEEYIAKLRYISEYYKYLKHYNKIINRELEKETKKNRK